MSNFYSQSKNMKKTTDYSIIIDTTGLKCPLPVLKVRKNLPTLGHADLALVIADDPLAEIDLKYFCKLKSYVIKNVSTNQTDKKQYFEIRR